jgi:hypothetical protein
LADYLRRPAWRVEDAPFGYVNAFKAHASVGFHYGAMLTDPARLLEGQGKRMRHVKLVPGKALDADALRDLIDAAYRDIRQRLVRPAARKPQALTRSRVRRLMLTACRRLRSRR